MLSIDHEIHKNNRKNSISIVVPLFNEEEVLGKFHKRLSSVLDQLDLKSEVIYVNDGSRDRSGVILDSLKQEDGRVSIIDLSRNFGKELAMTAGLDKAVGDAVVVIDADLQDPPELINHFVSCWKTENYDVVYGQRIKREGETVVKKTTAALFYKVMQGVGNVKIPENAGDFRLMNRRSVDVLNRLRERRRFMKGLFTWIGFSQKAIPYVREPRAEGMSKWNYWALWNFALEGITSFTIAPLKVASYMGVFTAFVAFCFGIFIIIKTLLYGDPVPGYPTIMVVILFLGGIQLTAIGLLGEYIGRIFVETKGRPLYIIDRYLPSELGIECSK